MNLPYIARASSVSNPNDGAPLALTKMQPQWGRMLMLTRRRPGSFRRCPFLAAAFDAAVFGTAAVFISYGRGPPYFAFAWDMISASDTVPDGFLFDGGDEGGVG